MVQIQRSENGLFFVYNGANFAWGVKALKGCGPCPLPKRTGGATAPNRATKAILVILETRIFAMTPIRISQPSALAGMLTPEALFSLNLTPKPCT